MCKLCEREEDCDCAEQLKTKIGMKCVLCGSYGFIERTETNIQRLEFFLEGFREQANAFHVCVIPMRGCKECTSLKDPVIH
jgi:hypothetical protein